jgi:N-acetylmuramoyl-L-alanine amidase
MYDNTDHILRNNPVPVPISETPNIGPGLAPEGIVLHDTAGRLDARTSIAWLCDRRARASAHFVVARDGGVTQLAPCNRQTWHAGRSAYCGRPGVNRFALGIEIVNPGRLERVGRNAWRAWFGEVFRADGDIHVRQASTPEHGDGWWMDYTAQQIAAVEGICRALVEAYAVQWIAAHWHVSPGRKVDTNPLFPLDAVRGRVLGRADEAEGAPAAHVRVTVDANQRRWPSLNDNVIQVLPRDTALDIVRFGTYGAEPWYLVTADGPRGRHDGWVNGAYVDIG